MIKSFRQVLIWFINNLYEIVLTVVCFLTLIEITPLWTLWLVIFGSFLFWILKKMGVIKPVKDWI